MDKTRLIQRYPDIDGELLRLGLIEEGRLWYLSKNLADKNCSGFVSISAVIEEIAQIAQRRRSQLQQVLEKTANLYDPNGLKGFCEKVSDGNLRLFGTAAVCRLLGIDRIQHYPVFLPLEDLCGKSPEVKYSFYESIVRAEYSHAFVSREKRAKDLGLSESSTIRYDKKLGLVLLDNWTLATDDYDYVFTSKDRAPLIQQAKGKARLEGMPKYITIDISALPVSLLRRIAPGQALGNYIMLERLPSTCEPHHRTRKDLLVKINNQLRTSANMATSSRVPIWKNGRKCNLIQDLELIEINCREAVNGNIRLWVPVQKVTPALRRRVPELSRLAIYGGGSNA